VKPSPERIQRTVNALKREIRSGKQPNRRAYVQIAYDVLASEYGWTPQQVDEQYEEVVQDLLITIGEKRALRNKT